MYKRSNYIYISYR